MDQKSASSLLDGVKERVSSSLFLKAIGLFFFCLLSLIPLSQVKGLLRERQHRQAIAIGEIADQWGGAQTLVGPLILAPASYEEITTEKLRNRGSETIRESKQTKRINIFIMPDTFNLEGELDPEWRHRGIFRTPVYTSSLKVSGTWSAPDLKELGYEKAVVDWSRARVVFKLTDPQGIISINSRVGAKDTQARPFLVGLLEGEWTMLGETGWESMPQSFAIEIGLRGADSFNFLPVGRQGEAKIVSSWANPSFSGSILPVSRSVGPDGFEGNWRFSEFGRGVPQAWVENAEKKVGNFFDRSICGVKLLDPINGYRMVDRSLKYGLLFIGVSFGVFFLFETLCGLRLHAMQYLLAGLANVLFFLLLLAMSEIIDFGMAYFLAGMGSTLLVAFYAKAILREKRNAIIVGGALVVFYAMLYIILRQQDYALLAGSVLLFATLAVVMFLTRKLDWSRSREARAM